MGASSLGESTLAGLEWRWVERTGIEGQRKGSLEVCMMGGALGTTNISQKEQEEKEGMLTPTYSSQNSKPGALHLFSPYHNPVR